MSDKDLFHKQFNEIVNAWLEEFGLKDLEEDYIPKIPQEVKNYIGNKDMRITQGSLVKLIRKEREHFIPFIKSTIEEPNIVMDNGRGILFVKAIEDENKNTYFMSISKNYSGEWIFSSHTRRELSNIKNEIAHSKIILNRGFERSEVAGACDILQSGGEVSKPSHLQIKYTANQDFGTNPKNIIAQKDNSNAQNTQKEMSDKEKCELAVFNLGKALVELVGEEQAIADLKELWKRHPEMFKDENDIARVTRIVALEPEVIIKNPTPLSEKDYIAGKKLNEEKMGEVGVRKDENIAKIFHINKKRIKNLDLLAKKEVVFDGRDAHTPYTQAQSLDGRLVQKNISSNTDEIITQNKPNSANSLNKEQNTNKKTQKEFSTEQIKAMQEEAKKVSQNLGLYKNTKSKDIEL